MSLQKTDAIVLRAINHGETSKILTLYTGSFGKVSVIAKGARNIKSRFGGLLEPPNYLSVIFYSKAGRELHYLNHAERIESFAKIRIDLEKTSLGMAVCELLNNIEAGQERNPLLFRLVCSTLRHINTCQESAQNIFRAFQIHMADIAGFRPNFESCMSCQKTLSGRSDFDLAGGGLVCESCHDAETSCFVLSAEAVSTLRILQCVHISKLEETRPAQATSRQIDSFLREYLGYHIDGGRDLRFLQFLQKIL